MKIVFLWEWTNTLDVVARFDEGIGEVQRLFAQAGHEVWITTWGGPAQGVDRGVNFKLFPYGRYDQWVDFIKSVEPDVITGWGTVDHKIFQRVREALPEVPLYMYLAGGGVDHPYVNKIDGFFVETNFHVEDLNAKGKPAWKALGVMTDILYPVVQQKMWDVFLPASFTVNKRYDLFCDVVEKGMFRGVAVGPVNDEGCLIECQKVYVPTFGYVSRSVLRDFYNASRVTLLTAGAWGGCQRALLESLACGTPVVTCDDNFQLDWIASLKPPVSFVPPTIDALMEEVRRLQTNPPDPKALRKWVLENFTSEHYYKVVNDVVTERLGAKC